MVEGTDGNIYGTTNGFNGQHLYGTVFQLSMGLAPFVKTVPAGAYTHTQVLILGNESDGRNQRHVQWQGCSVHRRVAD